MTEIVVALFRMAEEVEKEATKEFSDDNQF
jgi:hypothetical protein